ncbi:hypothetical protein [uncultured Desulfovibrio sp.]|uniref:hypothetical protein n=1 Tax=uncultured Desulfovibrio sp. TaxID=167968 RepID=UPI00263690C5|nr:hypothetical protein [uncultured Desulfovibrio sp.]
MSQLKEAQAWIDEHSRQQPVLCFCIHWEDRIPDEYFREIYRHIEKDFALCTLSTLEPDKFSMPGPIFTVSRQELKDLRGVRIFVSTDQYQNDFPDDAFVAAFPHSFLGYNTPLAFPGWQSRIYFQDAYFTTTPQTLRDAALIREELEGSCNPAHVRRKRPFYTFFPVGCPRIATVQAHLREMDCEQDTILYAPTGYWTNPYDPRNRMIGEFAPPMIDALLRKFPEYRICFRPCVTSWNHPDVQKLISLFEGHPRFAVSRDFDHLPEFARAITLVTEYSNIGEVFALSALRPEVRCTLEAQRKHLTISPTGVLVSVFDNVAQAVKIALDMPRERWERHIRSCYGQYIYDPAQTMPRIRQALRAVARGESLRESVAVRRVEGNKKAWDKEDFLRRILRPGFVEHQCARDFWRSYPDEPAALAMYLLIMRTVYPPYRIYTELSESQREYMEKMTGHPLSPEMRFADITAAQLENLLISALQKARQEGDVKLSIILLSVLENMERLPLNDPEFHFSE